MFPLNYFLY